MKIHPYTEAHRDAVVDLSLRAWAPVFASLEQVLEPAVYADFYPDGWQASQKQSVEETCGSDETHVWVAEESGAVAGFVAVKLHSETFGEICMIAVDPIHQRKGIALKLTDFAVGWMKGRGATVAMVDTGGDPGHAPARRTYEKAGFRLLPVSRYFKKL
jgi:ribosomal protein S18 acetylase RimI-like enzyme